jgi:hypothetical protein
LLHCLHSCPSCASRSRLRRHPGGISGMHSSHHKSRRSPSPAGHGQFAAATNSTTHQLHIVTCARRRQSACTQSLLRNCCSCCKRHDNRILEFLEREKRNQRLLECLIDTHLTKSLQERD